MVSRRNVFVSYLERFLKLLNRLIVVPTLLIGETLTVIEFMILRVQLYCFVVVCVGLLDLSQGQVGVTSVEYCSCIVGVKAQGFI